MRKRVTAKSRAIVRPAIFAFACLAGPAAGSPAAAQEYAARKLGDWTIAASKDETGCFVTRAFAGTGSTTLLLGLDIDGGHRLSVLNDNWSIRQKERLRLNFRLSNGGYADHVAVGITSGGQKGFVTSFDPKFPDYFAASRALHIYRGKVPVEQLSLDGSGAAVAELKRCVGIFKAKSAAGVRAKARSSRIPKDPFASERGRESGD